MTNHQYNLPVFAKRIAYSSNREGVADHFEDRVVRKSIAVDLALLANCDTLLTDLESYLVRQAKQHDPQAFALLRSILGVGKVLALTILYQIHDVNRFERVQQFASYARLVKCVKESAGKKHGRQRREDGQRPLEVGLLRSRGALHPPQRVRQEVAREARQTVEHVPGLKCQLCPRPFSQVLIELSPIAQ
jgi:transposase